jgi:hypothetical protein
VSVVRAGQVAVNSVSAGVQTVGNVIGGSGLEALERRSRGLGGLVDLQHHPHPTRINKSSRLAAAWQPLALFISFSGPLGSRPVMCYLLG